MLVRALRDICQVLTVRATMPRWTVQASHMLTPKPSEAHRICVALGWHRHRRAQTLGVLRKGAFAHGGVAAKIAAAARALLGQAGREWADGSEFASAFEMGVPGGDSNTYQSDWLLAVEADQRVYTARELMAALILARHAQRRSQHRRRGPGRIAD